jgi:hypothetical protein
MIDMVFDTSEMVLNRRNDYSWFKGYFASVDANVVGAICEKIEDRDGAVTRDALLEEAKDPDSPIHGLLEWNNDIAANNWRLDTCRKIITDLRVVVNVEGPDEEPKVLSAYVQIEREDTTHKAIYANVVDALTDEESRASILKRMYRDMQSFVDRYKLYDEASAVIAAIEDSLKER